LEKLNLSNTKITDQGLAALGNLAALQELDVSRTDISDASFDLLTDFATLKKLNIEMTRFTPDAVQRLKQRLPHCMITN